MTFPHKYTIAVIGGGSGPISIEDSLLKLTPNVIAITGVTDNGGHSKDVRSVLGVLPPGDATQRIAVRIRNQKVRELLTYRFKENKQRPINLDLAAAEQITGSHSAGIKRLEEAYAAWYIGRVIPISDNNIHLRIFLSDGTYFIGEEKLDERQSNDPKVVSIDYVQENPLNSGKFHKILPTINPEVVSSLLEADAIVIPPGSWEGSIKAVTEIPGFYPAVQKSRAKLIWFCNSVDFPGAKASDYLIDLTHNIGRPVDDAIINHLNHPLPKSYEKVNLHPVIADIDTCRKFAQRVHFSPITNVYDINGKPTIRHIGEIAASFIIQSINSNVSSTYTHPYLIH